MALYSLEIEKLCIATLLNYPNTHYQIAHIVDTSDFYSNVHRTIYSVLRQKIEANDSLDIIVITQAINNIGITFEDDVSIGDYLSGISMIQINELHALENFKELKKYTVAREISANADKVKLEVAKNINKNPFEIIQIADSIYSKKIASYKHSGGDSTEEICSSMIDKIEELGNKPQEETGYLGPFPTINRVFGSLLRGGNITIIGARTGVGKTSMGMYYMNYVAQKYNVPILHMDMSEMSPWELTVRTACSLSDGRVPYHAIESGGWRNNAQWENIVRQEVWPKVKRMKMFYEDVGCYSPDEIISFIRRFAINKIGRDKPFLIHMDYLKAFDVSGNTQEYQKMGQFIKDLKSLVQGELNVPVWTSLQLNRAGIIGNKLANQIDDTENTFGVSDRIAQQGTHAFILRRKSLEEKAEDGLEFGNMKLIGVKARHLGKDIDGYIEDVRMPDKSFKKNFFNINGGSFYFEERGDLRSMVNRSTKTLNIQKENTNQGDLL